MKRFLAAFVLPLSLGLFAAEVWIPGARTSGAEALAESLKTRGIPAGIGGEERIADDTRLIVFPPGYAVSDALRESLDTFYWRGGAIIVTDPRNLGAPAPRPASFRPLGGLRDPVSRTGTEKVRLAVREGMIRETNKLLVFEAKGDFNSEVLSVVLTDRAGRQFIHYADLERRWRKYALRFADFVFTGIVGNSELEFLLVKVPGATVRIADRIRPEEIVSVTFGISPRHAWNDKPVSFSLARIGAAGDAAPGADGRRSGILRRWTTQLDRIGVRLPTSFLDPLDGTDGFAVPDRQRIRGREADDKHFAEEMHRRAARRLVLAARPDGRPTAVLSISSSPRNPDPAWGAVVLPETAFAPGGEAVRHIVRMAEILLQEPHFTDVSFDLADVGGDVRLCARLRFMNPGAAIPGELSLTVGTLAPVRASVTLAPGANECTLTLGAIPEKFDFLHISWRVTLKTAFGGETVDDCADAAEMTEDLLTHLDVLQASHPDGRWSHHFFADVYAARAMAVLGVQTDRPDLIAKAERMIAGLVSRQHPDGALPMGYGERKRLAWVADNGTAALALVHLASWLPEKKTAYLGTVRRWYAWRESFRITPEKSAALRREFRDEKNTVPGFYGIGLNDGPYFEKGAKFPEPVRIERGPVWVLGISMASLPGYVRLTGDAGIRELARENWRVYREHAGPLNFFSAESVYWMYHYLADLPDHARAEAMLRDFMRRCGQTRGDALFGKGGRATLDHLPLLYCMRTFGSSPEARAVLARALLFQGSKKSPYSVSQVGDLYSHSSHGTSIAAARYAGSLTLVWLVELRYPGSTLLCE